MVNYDKIIDSRENDEDSKYTNKKLQRMIKKRLEKLTDMEGVEVWVEHNTWLYLDPEEDLPMNFKSNLTISKNLMQEIETLIRIIDCM